MRQQPFQTILVLAVALSVSSAVCGQAERVDAPAAAPPNTPTAPAQPVVNAPAPVVAAEPAKSISTSTEKVESAAAPTPGKTAGAHAKGAKTPKKDQDDDDGEWVLLPELPKAPAPFAPSAAAPSAASITLPARDVVPAASVASPGVEQRLALVIGNSNYKFGHLPNPVNDAQSITVELQKLGWKVIERENATRDEMVAAAKEFGTELAAGGIGLFYYAGHGVQSGNVNYLVPIDADIRDEDELAGHAFDSNELLAQMDQAKNRLNIVILDACRNNPFASIFASAKGLAGVQTGAANTDRVVSYATAPGATAADGISGNGLYTSALLHAMSQPGLGLEELFRQVNSEVKRQSGGKQIPYQNTSLTGVFYFNPTPEQAAALPMVAGNDGPIAGIGQSRAIGPVLVSRKLFENYQLAANLPLAATLAVGKFSADGKSFITATQDRKLRVWDLETGAITFSQPDFGAPSLSSNGRFLVGMTDTHAVNLVDTENKTISMKTYLIGSDVQSAAMSPDGRRLLIYTHENGFSLLNTENSAPVGESRKVDGDPKFIFAPSGNRLVMWGTKSDDLYLWDTEIGKRVARTSSHSKPVGLVRFSADGNLMLTAAAGDAAIVWQTSSGEVLRKLTLGDGSPLPNQAEFVVGGSQIVLNVPKSAKTPDSGYVLGIWDVATGKQTATLTANILVKAMRFSPDQQRLFVTASDNATRVFDLSTKAQVDALSGAELIGFSADGRRLIAHDGDGIRLYDSRSLSPLARTPSQVTAFIGPKPGNFYATAAADGSLRLIDFETGETVSVIKGHIVPVTAVSFSPSGKQLVTSSDDKIAKLWALPSVQDVGKLAKDSFESTNEYQKRVAGWSSDYTTLVILGEYNADTEAFKVRIGEFSVDIPMARDDARQLAGQREAMLTGRLKFHDAEQLQLADFKISRIP